MTEERNEKAPGAPRRKFQLSGAAISTLAGLLMGLMGAVVFFTRGLYAFQHGADDLGIGYMVLAAAFPVVITIVGWLMGRNADPRTKAEKADPRPAPRPEAGTSERQKEDPPRPGENPLSGTEEKKGGDPDGSSVEDVINRLREAAAQKRRAAADMEYNVVLIPGDEIALREGDARVIVAVDSVGNFGGKGPFVSLRISRKREQ